MKIGDSMPLVLGTAAVAGTVGLVGGKSFVAGRVASAHALVADYGSSLRKSETKTFANSSALAGSAGVCAAAVVALTSSAGRSRIAAKRLRAVPAAVMADVAAQKHWTKEIGATLPLCEPKEGMTRWDPAGLSSGKNAYKFDQYRAAEVKHGRVAMMAVVGLVSQHYFRFNGIVGQEVYSLEDVPSGFNALTTYPSSVGFAIIVLIAGIIETGVLSDEGEKPGYFGDPLGLRRTIAYAGIDDQLETMELEHGRLAMLGFIGTIWAEYTTGYDAVQQWEHASEGGGQLLRLMFRQP